MLRYCEHNRENQPELGAPKCPECEIKDLRARVEELEDAFRDPNNRTAHTQAQMCKFLDGLLKQVRVNHPQGTGNKGEMT